MELTGHKRIQNTCNINTCMHAHDVRSQNTCNINTCMHAHDVISQNTCNINTCMHVHVRIQNTCNINTCMHVLTADGSPLSQVYEVHPPVGNPVPRFPRPTGHRARSWLPWEPHHYIFSLCTSTTKPLDYSYLQELNVSSLKILHCK